MGEVEAASSRKQEFARRTGTRIMDHDAAPGERHRLRRHQPRRPRANDETLLLIRVGVRLHSRGFKKTRAVKARVAVATLAPHELTANSKFAPDEERLKCAVWSDAFAAHDNAWGRR